MMLTLAVAVAGMGMGSGVCSYSNGGPWADDGRPIATDAPYPAGMVDDVRRPGFNGRLWVTRPIMGGTGPWAVDEGNPGASAYGAFDHQNSTVYVRVVHTTIGVNAWERVGKRGLQHIEGARQFWLKEQGYTGGVRTFVNDAAMWAQPRVSEHASLDPAPAPEATHLPAGEIQPRATIQLPDGAPKRHRIRVEIPASGSPAAALADLPGSGPARVSWPLNAPGDGVVRSAPAVEAAAAPEPGALARGG